MRGMRNAPRGPKKPQVLPTPPQAVEADPNEVVATITLQLTRGGNLNVSGNIGDKVRAYGMLAVAKDVIGDWHILQAAKAPATKE